MSAQHFVYLSQEDAVACGADNIVATVKDVERATLLLYRDRAIEATTATLFWDLPKEDLEKAIGYKGTKRVNIHAAYLDDDGRRMVGVKNIPSNPENPRLMRGPRASGLLTMLDPDSGYPIALMDAAVISCTRTGALGALGARYLRKSGRNDVAIIGTGPINQAALQSLIHVCADGADIGRVHVFDLNETHAKEFSSYFASKHGLDIAVSPNAETAVRAADIIMPATTLTDPSQAYIPFEWLRPGALFIDLSIWDAKYEVFSKADRLYANSVEALDRHNLTPGCLVDAGLIQSEDLRDLGNLISTGAQGRANDQEIIVYFARGMAIYDAICGNRIYQNALDRKAGQKLTLWDQPYWP